MSGGLFEDLSLGSQGFSKLDIGDYKGAIADFDASLRIKNDDAFALAGRALGKQHIGDYKGALADFDASLRIKNNNAFALGGRAILKKIMGDYKGAIADFDASLALSTNNDDFTFQGLMTRGSCKLEIRDYKGAIADFDASLRIKNNDAFALQCRVIAKTHIKDYKGTIEDLDAWLRINNNNPTALELRAGIKQHTRDYQGALTDFDASLRINNNNPTALRDRAAIKFHMKDYQGALTDSDASLRIKNNDPLALSGRAAVRHSMGDYNGALEDYQALLHPGNNILWDLEIEKQATKNLAQLYTGCMLRELNRPEASDILRLVDPDSLCDFDKGLLRTNILILEKNYSEALRACDQALVSDPKSIYGHCCKAYILINLGLHYEAISCCDSALSFYAQNRHLVSLKEQARLAMEALAIKREPHTLSVTSVNTGGITISVAAVALAILLLGAKDDNNMLKLMGLSLLAVSAYLLGTSMHIMVNNSTQALKDIGSSIKGAANTAATEGLLKVGSINVAANPSFTVQSSAPFVNVGRVVEKVQVDNSLFRS